MCVRKVRLLSLVLMMVFGLPSNADDELELAQHMREVIDSITLAEHGDGLDPNENEWGLIRITEIYDMASHLAGEEAQPFEYGRVSLCNRGTGGGAPFQGYFTSVEPLAQDETVSDNLYLVSCNGHLFHSGPCAPSLPKYFLYSIYKYPGLVFCPLEEDGWPALHGVEENNFIVPESLQEDAIAWARWLNREPEGDGSGDELPEGNFYAIVGSVSADDPVVWDRAWEGEGLLNACMVYRVATLGETVDTLEFEGVDVIIARAEGAASMEELYWINIAYFTLRNDILLRHTDILTSGSASNLAISDRFEQLKQEEQGVEDEYRDRLTWLIDHYNMAERRTREELRHEREAETEAAAEAE